MIANHASSNRSRNASPRLFRPSTPDPGATKDSQYEDSQPSTPSSIHSTIHVAREASIGLDGRPMRFYHCRQSLAEVALKLTALRKLDDTGLEIPIANSAKPKDNCEMAPATPTAASHQEDDKFMMTETELAKAKQTLVTLHGAIVHAKGYIEALKALQDNGMVDYHLTDEQHRQTLASFEINESKATALEESIRTQELDLAYQAITDVLGILDENDESLDSAA